MFGRRASIFIGFISCLLLVLFSDLLISLFEPTTGVTQKANSYLILRSIGLPFYLLNMHSTAVLRGMKHPKITLYSSIIVGVSNVILSFLLAVIFAYLIRGNFVAALLGTFVGNPLTFPFIWSLIYNVGIFITSKNQRILNSEISFDMILNQTYEIFIPMLIGGAIISFPIWLITFLVTYSFVSSYKKSKAKKKLHNNSKDI